MKRLAIAAFLIALTAIAMAQVVSQPGPPTPIACAYNTTPVTLTSGQAGWVQCDAAGKITTTSTPGATGASLTSTAITVTNASASFLAAATATKYLLCKNESTTASIALNFAAGTAVLNTAGNITLPPGASITFDGSAVPSGAITGISSAATSPASCLSL